MTPRGRHEPGRQPADYPWTRTSERTVWQARKSGLVLTVSRRTGGAWAAEVSGPGVCERSDGFATRLKAQAWCDRRAGDRAGGAS